MHAGAVWHCDKLIGTFSSSAMRLHAVYKLWWLPFANCALQLYFETHSATHNSIVNTIGHLAMPLRGASADFVLLMQTLYVRYNTT
jgi:hypothetical protein